MRKISTIEKFISSILTLMILTFTIMLHISGLYVIYKSIRICNSFMKYDTINMKDFKKVLIGFIFESLIFIIISLLRHFRRNIDEKNIIEIYFDNFIDNMKIFIPKILERLQKINKWVYYNINV